MTQITEEAIDAGIEELDYDIRALQKSGLEDPWAMGLILPDDFNLRDYVQKVA